MGTRERLGPKLRLNAIGTHVLNPSTLDYMLRVMRDETAEPTRRDAMAKAAAPYVHPSLASVRHGGDEQNPLRITEVRRIIVDPRNLGNSDKDQAN